MRPAQNPDPGPISLQPMAVCAKNLTVPRLFRDIAMAERVSVDTVLMQRPDRASATIDEVTAVMDADADAYLLIDAIGSVIWARLTQPTRMGALCEELTLAYDVDAETCSRDVLEFADDLVRRGLAVVA